MAPIQTDGKLGTLGGYQNTRLLWDRIRYVDCSHSGDRTTPDAIEHSQSR